jgi:hypothetical protein
MAKPVWIGYDLGVRGDYEGLFAWLDAHGAKECSDSLAFVHYEYTGSLHESLARELRKKVKISKDARIYIVWDDDGKTKGRFIIGGRKAAPWSGYAMLESAEVDEA